ncbi:MAG TPA: 50S ribosomal protein L5 [Candidatus Norongarragalinales archaeon]|nr:50S ribosomal protein L5 [Candidatus Norongarragalinales archaeon]
MKIAVSLDKVTVNIGVGQGGQPLENARLLLQQLTQQAPINTLSQTRNPTFKLRMGEPIGAKVTLRGKPAEEFVKKALEVKERRLPSRSFGEGNVSFGVPEYIDFPGAKYDPNIGMLGFDVCVTLKKPGKRITQRRIAPRKLPKKQRVSPKEAMGFMKERFSVDVVES